MRDKTIYVKWEETRAKFTFKLNGDSGSDINPSYMLVDKNTGATTSVTVKEGYSRSVTLENTSTHDQKNIKFSSGKAVFSASVINNMANKNSDGTYADTSFEAW